MRMKTVLMIACTLFMGASAVNAQNTELPKDGDLFQGLTRSITYDRMIPPHGLQVTFDKTVHIIFPWTWVLPTSWLARLTVQRM